MSNLQRLIAQLVEAVPLPQVVVGGGERVTALNSGARQMFGAGMLGRHYVAVLRQPALLDSVEEVLKLRKPVQARYLSRETQRDATWKVTVSPLDLGDGAGALVTFEDATAAEEAGQIRRDFVANVSHELRTPLTAMLGFVETLRGAARQDPQAQERFLLLMEEEALRMNRLVHDLLSLSRVESEERVRPRGLVEMGGLIASVASALKKIVDARGVRIVRAGLDEPIQLPGDPDQLFQVFSNLIENAIKYGGAEKEIVVSASRNARDPILRAPAVRVSITDHGPGIEAIHIPRLTERFYRVDTHRSRELGGTGLGLAIVKHIVNRHRGRLRVESELGKGSTFTVILPTELAAGGLGEQRPN